MTVEEVLNRQKLLEDERETWEHTWQEIIDYVVPRRTEIEEEIERGQRGGKDIYNGVGLDALKLLSDGLQGDMMSSTYKWFSWRMENDALNNIPVVKRWLQTVESQMFGFFSNSNFYRQVHEMFMDAGSFGTAFLYVEPDLEQQRFVFTTRQPKECYISTNKYEQVDTLHRKFYWTPRKMVQAFGDKVHDDFKEMAEKKSEKRFPILHAVYPNSDRDYLKTDNQNMPWKSQYIDMTKRIELRSGGYNTFPYAAWRFYKNTEEDYGRSPAWNALAEIKGVNAYDKTGIWAAQMAVKPPMWNPASQRNKLRIVPGGMNYYEHAEAQLKPEPIITGIKEPVNLELIQRKEEAINKHFMTDFFLIVARKEKEMTATETRELQEEKAIILGPTVNGLETEAIEPIMDRMFDLGLQLGWIARPPEILLRGGGRIKIDYVGPLAQAQRRLFRNQPIRSTMQEVFPMIEIKPETMDNFNWDFMARELAEGADLPQGAFVDPEVMQQIRQQRAQAMEQQRQAELAATTAPAMETMAKAQEG